MLNPVKHAVERLLEAIVIALMAVLAVVVLVGITWRAAGAALSWYDESASILLCWLTFYGAALAALKRAHIGVPGVVAMMPPTARAVTFVVAEALVFGFFLLVAWIGWVVIEVLEGSYLVSIPEIPVSVAQSVIPIGAALFIVGEALSLPEAWRRTMPPPAARDLAATE